MGLEMRLQVEEHLFELLIALRLDRLAVQTVTGLEPVPQQSGLADPAAAVDHQQPATVRGRGEFLLFMFAIDEGEFH